MTKSARWLRKGDEETNETIPASRISTQARALRKREAITLAAILALAFTLRAVWLLQSGSNWAIATDSHLYLSLARGIHNGCGFTPFDLHRGAPEVLRTPGYPMFLVPFLSNYRTVIYIQALMGTLVCLLAARFTAKRFGWTSALVAAMIIAVDVPTILASKELLTEALFQLLFTIAIFSALAGYAFSSGILLGATALVRPVAEPMITMIVLPFILVKRWRGAAVAAGMAILVICAWAYRNHNVAGVFTLTVEGSMNLYSYTVPGILARHDGVSLAQAQGFAASEVARVAFADRPEMLARTRTMPPHDVILWATQTTPAIAGMMSSRSAVTILQHPIDAAFVTLGGLARLAFMPHEPEVGLAQIAKSPQQFVTIKFGSMAFEGAMLAFVWIGVLQALWRNPRDANLLVLLCTALLFLLAAAPYVDGFDARFRSPAIPFLAILAGAGWGMSKHGRYGEEVPRAVR